MILSSFLGGLLDGAARSLLLAVVVGAGLAALRTRNVVAQKAAWILVLFASMLMPAVAPWASRIPGLPDYATILLPRTPWLAHQAGNTSNASAAPLAVATANSAEVSGTAVQVSNVPRPAEPTASRASGTHFPAPTISHDYLATSADSNPVTSPADNAPLTAAGFALLLYLSVCIILLARVAFGLWTAARLWLDAETVSAEDATGLRIRSSRRLSSPVTVGSGIVLPDDYADWDTEKLRIVLAHEGSHVRQGDFCLQLCASIYTALFWFSPLGWWLKRKLSDLSETISDRAAVGHAASHASYAQVLLEFAALPRPIPIGVAMAHHGRLIPRIERLLNESSFRQAFAGGRGRIAAAVLLVPIALFAATALVRVQAAQSPPQPPAAPAAAPVLAQPPSAPAPPAKAPSAAAADAAEAPEPPEPLEGVAAPAVAPVPPLPPVLEDESAGDGNHSWAVTTSQSESTPGHTKRRGSSFTSSGRGYAYSYQSNGDSYALVSGNDNVSFSGDWYEGRKAELDKARSMAHGDFLWFTRNGKSYVIDDPVITGQIKEMYKPMEDLGKQQEALGTQQEELGKKQEALGRQQEQASVPTPDMSKAVAEVEKAVAALKAAKGQQITQDKLADMQEKLAELQGKLGDLQGQVGSKQGELGAQQGKLGEMQGKLGEQQGKLGEQQGRIAKQADQKVKSIIDESLKNGKARPVQ